MRRLGCGARWPKTTKNEFFSECVRPFACLPSHGKVTPSEDFAMLLDSNAVKEIFLAAIDKPTLAERSAYRDAACADNADLRQRIQSLLKEHQESGSFPDFLAEQPADGFD